MDALAAETPTPFCRRSPTSGGRVLISVKFFGIYFVTTVLPSLSETKWVKGRDSLTSLDGSGAARDTLAVVTPVPYSRWALTTFGGWDMTRCDVSSMERGYLMLI